MPTSASSTSGAVSEHDSTFTVSLDLTFLLNVFIGEALLVVLVLLMCWGIQRARAVHQSELVQLNKWQYFVTIFDAASIFLNLFVAFLFVSAGRIVSGV